MPVGTAIVTAAVAVVLAAATFSSSLSENRDEASRYGVTWDVAARAMSTPEEAAALGEEVRVIPGVIAFSGMGTTSFDTPFGEIPSNPVVTIASITVVAASFLVLLVLTALVPAQLASRVPASDILRRD